MRRQDIVIVEEIIIIQLNRFDRMKGREERKYKEEGEVAWFHGGQCELKEVRVRDI